MKVAYTSPFVPVEWIAAHGLTPMRVRPRGAAAHIHQGQCAFSRAFVEELPSLGAQAAVFTTTCDQMRRAAECGADILSASSVGVSPASLPFPNSAERQAATREQGCGLPVFLMNVPVTWQSPAAAQMYVQELRRLGGFLVRLGGRSPTPAHLAEVMADYEQARMRLIAVAERGADILSASSAGVSPAPTENGDGQPFSQTATARKRRQSPFSARQFQESLLELHQLPYEQVRGVPWSRCLRPRPHVVANAATTAPAPMPPIPVAVVGGPLSGASLELLDMIEAAGGHVVLDATETGLRSLPAAIGRRPLADDSFAELAAIYFGGIGDAFRRPNSLLYEWLGRHVERTRPRGIVLIHQVWCDLWHAELARLREWTPGTPISRSAAWPFLADREIGVPGPLPVLQIADDGSPSARASAATRIQSFLEMLR